MSADSLAPITTCDRCGADLAPGARYCANCGRETGGLSGFAPLPAQPTTIIDPYASPGDGYAGPSNSRAGIGKLFSATGRIGRTEYFLTVVGIWAFLIVTWGIVIVADAPLLTIVLGFTSLIVCTVVAVCAGIKRLHDIGQTGWLYLIFLIPLISLLFLFFLLLKGPDSTHNQYGFEGSGSLKG